MRVPKTILVALIAVLVWGCSKDPEVAKREYLESAQRYVKEGKLQEAAVEYRNAIQQDPRFGQARFELAGVLLKTGDSAGAYREYVRAADLLPEDLEAQAAASEIILAAGQFEDAGARAERALALDPRSVRAMLIKANALAGMRKFDEAVVEVESAIALDPSNSASFNNLGALQLVRGNRAEAEQAYKRAVEVAPDRMEARVALAGFYTNAGQPLRAEAVLSEAMQVDPKSVPVNRALAALYQSTQRPDKAEAPLKLVVDETRDLGAMIVLADYYRSTRRVDDALKVLADAATLSDEAFSAATARKASMLRENGKKAEASAAIEAVLVKRPADVLALSIKSQFLADDGKLDDALKSARAATEASPNSFEGYLALGHVQQLRRALPEATAAYAEVLKLQPNHPVASLELARLSVVAGQSTDGARYARQALAAQPGNADAQLLLARAQINTGELAAAEPTLRALAEKYPQVGAVHAQLGILALVRKDRAAARAAFERALALDASLTEPLEGLIALDIDAGNVAGGRARADAALVKNRGASRFLWVAAQTYERTGDAARAEALLKQIIEVSPSSLQAYAQLASIYASQKRLDAAVGEFEKIIARSPKAVGALTLTGILFETQQKTSEARKRYEQALAADPNAAVAANNLAMIYAANKENLDQALQLAQTAMAALPDSPEVSDTLGWVYYLKGLHSQAISALKNAVDRSPSRGEFKYHLGLAYSKNGDSWLARRELEAALALDGNSPLAAEARMVIAGITR